MLLFPFLEANSTNRSTVKREIRAHTIYLSLSMSCSTKDQKNFAAYSVYYIGLFASHAPLYIEHLDQE